MNTKQKTNRSLVQFVCHLVMLLLSIGHDRQAGQLRIIREDLQNTGYGNLN